MPRVTEGKRDWPVTCASANLWQLLADRQESMVMEILYVLGFVVAWFALQRWILPRLGIRT